MDLVKPRIPEQRLNRLNSMIWHLKRCRYAELTIEKHLIDRC